ncbi:MAG: class I SAM-dependent methyltransferase [Chloroflexi bacterium]|nr:MAG: class I SAM-dependent methyltransferase [Chloroflexota bacterium]
MTNNTAPLEGEDVASRLNRYRAFDEVNAPYLRWQLEQFEPWLGQRVLEVGCGVGGVLAQLGNREFVMGIDLEEDIIAYTRSRFNGGGAYRFATLDISALSEEDLAELSRHRFDTIICINVLEHVEDDAAAVAAMKEILTPGGHVTFLVPAHPSLYGRYDAMEGHFRRYTRRGLQNVVANAGLTVDRIYSFNFAGAAGWFVQYKVLRRNIHGRPHFRILQATLPVLKAVESRIKPPVGLSLVCVAHKP